MVDRKKREQFLRGKSRERFCWIISFNGPCASTRKMFRSRRSRLNRGCCLHAKFPRVPLRVCKLFRIRACVCTNRVENVVCKSRLMYQEAHYRECLPREKSKRRVVQGRKSLIYIDIVYTCLYTMCIYTIHVFEIRCK